MSAFGGGAKCLDCGNRIGSRYDHADWCPEHPQNQRLAPDGGREERLELESAEDLPDECQDLRCTNRPQKIIEVEIADAEPDRFAFCMLCLCETLRRVSGDNVRVIGP